ncbi:MAG TPA: GSU2403 family nucleotidyltransferase fold protein [Usitatibacter sp.]|nr:GSU2403 family nucleotidyltransferase fold protein [Usitatibacter sp.]
MRYAELPLAAQTAYAELAEQTRAFETGNALAGLVGSFQKLKRKGQDYWYFAYREGDKVRMSYVGPDDARVSALVERFRSTRRRKPLAPQATSAIALGCTATAPKHFRIIKRLSDYGFFRAGGVLIGTHAFVALANLLGVRWSQGSATLDVDFGHAGRNISIALPADLRIDVHGALESLEMGLLPLTEFEGGTGAQYRNPRDQELRLDFVTSAGRKRGPVLMPELNLALEPLKFMEYCLERTTQACVFDPAGACTVNIPVPERYAVHKLLVYGERPASERTKARKDLMQSASLAEYFHENGRQREFNAAWRDAVGRGAGWRKRALEGKRALLLLAPALDLHALWKEK